MRYTPTCRHSINRTSLRHGLENTKVLAVFAQELWASWGERRSVIALKDNVKFTYENGKLMLPDAGEKLWKAIEPPHAGKGLAPEAAVPFVLDVPLPQ